MTIQTPAIVPTTAALRAQAVAAHAPYPQYAGYFDAWVRARVTATIRTKAGLAVKAGDYVLAKPGTQGWLPAPATLTRTFYSVPTGAVTTVSAGSVVDAPEIGETCADCGALIGEEQETYVYRYTDIDGLVVYEPLCPACDRKE